MRLWAFTTTFWKNADEAARKGDEWLGLRTWHERVRFYLQPQHCFLACGTWSDPAFSTLPPAVAIINAGIALGTPYDTLHTQLWEAAATSAMAYALNQADQWDLLVFLDTDILIGAVDFGALLNEFASRPETLLAQAWWDGIGGAIYAWKHAGAIHLLHSNPWPSIVDPSSAGEQMESKWARLYKGRWWNPWPTLKTIRQDYRLTNPIDSKEVMQWPFVGRPDPSIQAEYERTQTALAKPVA